MKVVKKQNNSKMCIICGLYNDSGLKAPFYELEDKRVATLFEYKDIHQSYPGRAHGGMISCMLDELAGRVIWAYEPDTLAVTSSLKLKFRKPVPYDVPLGGVGTLLTNGKRGFTAKSEIFDQDGKLLAEGEAIYVKLPPSKITDVDMVEQLDEYLPDDVKEINI